MFLRSSKNEQAALEQVLDQCFISKGARVSWEKERCLKSLKNAIRHIEYNDPSLKANSVIFQKNNAGISSHYKDIQGTSLFSRSDAYQLSKSIQNSQGSNTDIVTLTKEQLKKSEEEILNKFNPFNK